MNSKISPSTREEAGWQEIIAPYRQPAQWKSAWQLVNSFFTFVGIWVLMLLSLSVSYWLTLALTPLAAGLHLRLFIIFHDCGHHAFFKSAKANDILGIFLGVLCFTPYYHWRHFHAIHHATVGNLDGRIKGELIPLTLKKYTQNNGDVLTLTVKEYQQLTRSGQLFYKVYRNPFLLFLVIPFILFVVIHRFTNPRAEGRERRSVLYTNLAILGLILVLGFTIGFGSFLLVELPIVILSTIMGVWLFYIQHQFENTYWQDKEHWDFVQACLQGSSYYKLPVVLQWFTGNIGFHHIHHLSPRIPNYYLQKCHKASPLFENVVPLTIKSGMGCVFMRLWDEDQQKMVSFPATRHSKE